MSDPFVCSRCAAQGPTCCQLAPGQEEVCFPVSEAEKGRIRELFPDSAGFELSPNSAAFMDNLLKLFPDEREHVRGLFHPRKDHLRLSVDKKGRCKFLAAQGCALPREVRPYYCRLFPFWMRGGKLSVFDAPGCLACQEASGTGDLLRKLDVSVSTLRDLHGRLRMAWGLDPEEGGGLLKKGF